MRLSSSAPMKIHASRRSWKSALMRSMSRPPPRRPRGLPVRIDVRAILRLPWPTLVIGLVGVGFGIACLVVALSGTQAAELLATPAKPPAELKIAFAAEAPADLGSIQSQPLLHA